MHATRTTRRMQEVWTARAMREEGMLFLAGLGFPPSLSHSFSFLQRRAYFLPRTLCLPTVSRFSLTSLARGAPPWSFRSAIERRTIRRHRARRWNPSESRNETRGASASRNLQRVSPARSTESMRGSHSYEYFSILSPRNRKKGGENRSKRGDRRCVTDS